MRGWQTLQHPRFPLVLRYPPHTPRGHAVEKRQEERDGSVRVHLFSPGSPEMYVELTLYPSLTSRSEYVRHRDDLAGRFPELEVSELAEASWASRPAHEYSFTWKDGTRAVILVEIGTAVLRLLFDPRSDLNAQVLASVQLTGEPD